MSDKTNNLNQNSDNIQFDEGKQDHSTEPNKQGAANKATAPLPELPDTDNHSDEEKQDNSSEPDKPSPVKKATAPLNELPDTEDDHLAETIKSEPSISEHESSDSSASPNDNKVDGAKLVESIQPVQPKQIIKPLQPKEDKEAIKPLQPAQSEETDEPEKSVQPVQSEETDKPEKSVQSSQSGKTDEPEKSVQSSQSEEAIKPLQSKEDKEAIKPLPSAQPEATDTSDKPETDTSSPSSDNIKFTRTGEKDKDNATIHSRRAIFGDKEDGQPFLTFNTRKDDPTPVTNPDTAVLSEKSAVWRKVIEGQTKGTTSSLGEQREVLFVIRGMIERVVMKDNSTVTLGRFDTGTVPNEEIDLIPYGAIDRGVSRRHCKIQLQENQLHVIDLQSTNGTFLAGVRLRPNEPTVLRKGDELLLGRLAVQVLFR